MPARDFMFLLLGSYHLSSVLDQQLQVVIFPSVLAQVGNMGFED